MSTATTIQIDKSSSLIRSKPGWLGVDIGTRTIKLAQVERAGNTYHIKARWTLPGDSHPILSRDVLSSDGMKTRLSSIKTLRRLFSGQNCAAVLPMSMVDFRSFSIPPGSPEEVRRMIGEELAVDLNYEPEELAFDYWETNEGGVVDDGLTHISALAIPRELAARLVTCLSATGLICRTLNGMPCALARAVEISEPSQNEEAVAVVDLGYTSPQVVLVQQGKPLFARTLRDSGLETLIQPLQSSMKISSTECQHLLLRYGLSIAGQSPSVASQKTMPFIASPLQNLVSEIKRTLDYIRRQFPKHLPQRILLFGGGALVKNMPEYLEQKLHLPTSAWNLDGSLSENGDAFYGISAALSSLAWEDGSCK